jgi:hypothetical protein
VGENLARKGKLTLQQLVALTSLSKKQVSMCLFVLIVHRHVSYESLLLKEHHEESIHLIKSLNPPTLADRKSPIVYILNQKTVFSRMRYSSYIYSSSHLFGTLVIFFSHSRSLFAYLTHTSYFRVLL